MSDIFISYSRQDRPRAEALVEILRTEGVSIWWDRELIAGELYNKVIEEQLHSARCVIVLWSVHSVDSNWVFAEANEGANRHVLVPVLLDDVTVPLAFRALQAVSLVNGLDDADALASLASAVRRLVGERTDVDPLDVLVRVSCSACGAANTAPAHLAGRRGKCRQCGEGITIPGEVGGAPRPALAARPAVAAAGQRPGATRRGVRGPSSSAPGRLIGAVLVVLAALLGLVLWSGDDDGSKPTPGPIGDELSGTDGGGHSGSPTPASPRDQRLVDAHARLEELGGAEHGEPAALLAVCRLVLDEIAPADPHVAALLASLASRPGLTTSTRAQVADLKRWIGRPLGQLGRFEQTLARFEQQLSGEELDDAEDSLAICAQLLPTAHELPGARQRLADARSQAASARQLEQQGRELLAALDEAGEHLPSLSAALDEASAFADEHTGTADSLALPAAIHTARAAHDARRLALESQLDAVDRAARDTQRPGDLVEALKLADVCFDELPGTATAPRLDDVTPALSDAARRLLERAADQRPGLELLLDLAPARPTLVSGPGARLGGELARQALAQVQRQLATLSADEPRARALVDLAGAAAGLSDSPPSRGDAARLVSLADDLLAQLAGPAADTTQAARQQLSHLDELFPLPLVGAVGEHLEARRAALRALIDSEGERLAARLREARELLAQGRSAAADEFFVQLIKDVDSDSATFAAARLGRVDVLAAQLPATLSPGDVKAVEKVLSAYQTVRRFGDHRDPTGLSVPALCTFGLVKLHKRLRDLYAPLMRGGRDQNYTSRFNNADDDLQDELRTLRSVHGDERGDDGALLVDAAERL